MKHQALFSSKNKSKNIKSVVLLGTLRVKSISVLLLHLSLRCAQQSEPSQHLMHVQLGTSTMSIPN